MKNKLRYLIDSFLFLSTCAAIVAVVVALARLNRHGAAASGPRNPADPVRLNAEFREPEWRRGGVYRPEVREKIIAEFRNVK